MNEISSDNVLNSQIKVVTVDKFNSTAFLEPLSGIIGVDSLSMYEAYTKAATEAKTKSNVDEASVYELFASICSFHLIFENGTSRYGPLMVLADGTRSFIPEDLKGEQSKILSEVLPAIKHSALRARVSDVIWTNSKNLRTIAEIAIDSYIDVADALFEDPTRRRFQHDLVVSFEDINPINRAIDISRQINKRGAHSDRLKSACNRLYVTAKKCFEPSVFVRVGEIMFQHQIISAEILAKEAEDLAKQAVQNDYPHHYIIKNCFFFAAEAYLKAKNKDASRRCRICAVEQIVATKSKNGSKLGQIGWLRTAIMELRNIEGSKERIAALKSELVALQDDINDELGIFSVPFDVEDIRTKTISIFNDMSLPSALAQFALISPVPNMDLLREQVLSKRYSNPLISMFSSLHLDHDGKVISETSPGDYRSEPNEQWIKAEISRDRSYERQVAIAAYIEPARVALSSRFTFSERIFRPIVSNSPFVPASHAYIFALGFSFLFNGDVVSASHLLIPQLENSVRYILKNANQDPSKLMADMTQEDRPLSSLLTEHRETLSQIFGSNLLSEIDLLFNFRPGPALRHEFAHGKIGTGGCMSPQVLFACWFIYSLCSRPLMPHWGNVIGPEIEKEGL